MRRIAYPSVEVPDKEERLRQESKKSAWKNPFCFRLRRAARFIIMGSRDRAPADKIFNNRKKPIGSRIYVSAAATEHSRSRKSPGVKSHSCAQYFSPASSVKGAAIRLYIFGSISLIDQTYGNSHGHRDFFENSELIQHHIHSNQLHHIALVFDQVHAGVILNDSKDV